MCVITLADCNHRQLLSIQRDSIKKTLKNILALNWSEDLCSTSQTPTMSAGATNTNERVISASDDDAVYDNSFKVKPYPEERRASLRKWNIGAGVLHLIQSIAQLGLALSVDSFKDFQLPITTSYLGLVEVEGTDISYLATTSRNLGNVRLGPLIFIFFLLSAFFHFLTVIPYFNEHYWNQINRGKNYFRWIEYSISSTVMIWYKLRSYVSNTLLHSTHN